MPKLQKAKKIVFIFVKKKKEEGSQKAINYSESSPPEVSLLKVSSKYHYR